MNVLLTGSEGFVGSHVKKLLLNLGHKVYGIDPLEPRIHLNGEYNLLNRDLFIATAGHGFYTYESDSDIVIHLGAQVGVADSMKDPLRYIRGNTEDTAKFLQNLELHSDRIQRLVVASSMSVYGAGGEKVSEYTPVCPENVYALTKYDQERLCLMWGRENDVEVTALRLFNVYGPGQALHNPYTGVLANFCNWIMSGERPIVYEDGQQTRDFVYVEDVAEAIVKVALGDVEGALRPVYNICTGVATTIEKAARTLILAFQGETDLTPNITFESRPGDIRHCVGDPTWAMKDLGWKAKTGFEDGIGKYVKHLNEVPLVTVE